MMYQWGSSRRFNAYSDFFKSEFGGRVQKLTINAGFTCPNRTGKKGKGGCTFCDNSAFIPSYNEACKPVNQQIDEGIEFHKNRYRRVKKYLAYFQAYTNTYASLKELKRVYMPALSHPEVVGIVIGTRPDCIDVNKLDYFAELAEDKYIVIEYGIESVNNEILESINRGHTFEQSVWAINETAKRGIYTGGHMIVGLPGENRSNWLQSIDILSELPLHSLKFHQLQLIKGTAMAIDYEKDPNRYLEFTMEEYLQLMCEMIEKLNPEIIIERIAGEVNPEKAVRKGWGIRYDQVLSRFEKILDENNTWQGRLFVKKS